MGEFDMVVGVVLVGLFINTYLYGLVTYQYIVYHTTAFNDRIWIKSIVGSLFVLDTLHSAVAVYAGWQMCVTNYNNPASLSVISWTLGFSGVANAFSAFITQVFLGHRVFVLTKSKPLVACIAFLSLVGLILGMYGVIEAQIIHDLVLFGKLHFTIIPWLALETVTDILITASLTYVVSRSRTGFRRTDTIINRIIRGAVGTGFFASMFSLGALFSFLFAHHSSLLAMFAYPLGRIYTNTLLDTLNARAALRGVGSDSDEVSYRMQTQTHTIGNHGAHSIHVQKDVITDFVDEERVVDTKYVLQES